MSVYMHNKTLVTIKNQLVLKAEKLKSMFAMDYVTNCFVFVFFTSKMKQTPTQGMHIELAGGKCIIL